MAYARRSTRRRAPARRYSPRTRSSYRSTSRRAPVRRRVSARRTGRRAAPRSRQQTVRLVIQTTGAMDAGLQPAVQRVLGVDAKSTKKKTARIGSGR